MQLPYAIRSLGQRALRHVRRPVGSGVNRGFRWSVVSSGRGYGSGRFGVDRLDVLGRVTRAGDCFWDVGAHKGFVTLAASRMVGPTGSVVSIEPGASNLWFLRHHLEWNGVDRVRVAPVALSDWTGQASFGGRGDSLAYRLGKGDTTVDVLTVPDVIERFGVSRPTLMKIDAEAEEAAILRGAGDLIGPDLALLISVHGPALRLECRELLQARDFRILESADMARAVEEPDRPWRGDHDLLALGPDRDADLESLARLALFSR